MIEIKARPMKCRICHKGNVIDREAKDVLIRNCDACGYVYGRFEKGIK